MFPHILVKPTLLLLHKIPELMQKKPCTVYSACIIYDKILIKGTNSCTSSKRGDWPQLQTRHSALPVSYLFYLVFLSSVNPSPPFCGQTAKYKHKQAALASKLSDGI